MNYIPLTAVFEMDNSGGYFVSIPEVPEFFAFGNTLEETQSNFVEELFRLSQQKAHLKKVLVSYIYRVQTELMAS